jgi:predicted RNA binding protein YcfA (HicA-like mRNA interferase family)
MPPRPLPFREVQRRLEAAEFRLVRSKGSHVKFAGVTDQGTRTDIVPDHRDVAIGTLRSVLRQAGLTWEEFDAL